MQTGFCDWSARYFAQPVMKVSPESFVTSAASVPLPEAGISILLSPCLHVPGVDLSVWSLLFKLASATQAHPDPFGL